MLYIIRHGKTDWNSIHKLQGRTDIPLNEEGRRMAMEAAPECAEMKFDICYSSPLKRALETARLLLEGTGVPIVTDDRLKEMCFGIYEGAEQVYDKEQSPILPLFKDPANYIAVPEGESFEELFARTGAFLEERVKPDLAAGKRVLIVGHGAMNCSIVCQWKHLPLERFWEVGIPNCKLIRLD